MSSDNRKPANQPDGVKDSNEDTLLPQYAPWDYCDESNSSLLRNIIPAPDLIAAENLTDRNIYHLLVRAIKYYPESISVKQNGRTITFECKQAERFVDSCWMSSVMVRRVVIPSYIDLKLLETRLTNDYTISVLGFRPTRNVPITMNIRPVAQQPQYPRNVVREPRMYDLQTSQRLMEAAYKSMAAPGYSYWSMYPDNYVDTHCHLRMQYGSKPTPKARPQGQREVRYQKQSQVGGPQGQYQGHHQEQSRFHPQNHSQVFFDDYQRSHSQGYPHRYFQGQYPQDYPRGYLQYIPQDDFCSYPQSHTQGRAQVYTEGFPQAQVNPRDNPQKRSQGASQQYCQEYQQNHPQSCPQGLSQGRSQSNDEGYPQDYSQSYPAVLQEYSQGWSDGYSQVIPQDYPQGRAQAPPPGQHREPMGNGNPPGMRCERLSPLRELSPADSYEMLSAPSEDDDEETDYCSKTGSD